MRSTLSEQLLQRDQLLQRLHLSLLREERMSKEVQQRDADLLEVQKEALTATTKCREALLESELLRTQVCRSGLMHSTLGLPACLSVVAANLCAALC